ncbi:MAG: PQQ-dependent sugar dehydrogenase [Leptolyngbyaceae cyanobacterium bins.349]|nr:PQQ-dependent sugar dehydrogenase [Leptolyngbyaceae cyanobacterium bins.349]
MMKINLTYLAIGTRSAIALFSSLAMLAISGCSTQATPDASAPANSPIPTPVSPNASPSPIAAAVKTIRQTTVLQGLEHPWSIVWLPDGSQLITERPGRVRIVRNGVLDPTPIAGVPEVLAQGQGGLLDISLHPRFAQNGLVYLTYAHGTSDANRTRLARAKFDGKALQNLQVIYEVDQTKSGNQHFGSRILWLPDGTLLLAIGDGGNPPVSLNGDLIRKQAQNLQSSLGKIVRLNDDGTIPSNNPFVANAKAKPSIWSYGHRNIQGLAFDPKTQRVWSTEHGARGGDELNLVQAGRNHGWPLVTYSREYFGPEITDERSRPGFVDPKTVWTPATAPSGLAFYTSDRVPQWQGNLFAGGLVSRDVRRISLDTAGNVVSQQEINIGARVRDVRQGPDGLLYVLTDEPNGKLIRLEPGG